jgi:hypothetical protein
MTDFNVIQKGFNEWRESMTLGKPVSNVRNPGTWSAENLILFSIEAYYMGGISAADVNLFIAACRMEPGRFVRYPGKPDKHCSHDDYTALAVFDPQLAKEIYLYGEAHGWDWPGVGYLARIPDFKATVKAGANVKLELLDVFFASLGIIWDGIRFRSPNADKPGTYHVGGSLLIALKQRVLEGKSFVLNLALDIWRIGMRWKFKTLRELFRNYFGESSPFYAFSPNEFSITKETNETG